MNLARGQPLFDSVSVSDSYSEEEDSESEQSGRDANEAEELEPITDADLLPSAYTAPLSATLYPDSDSDAPSHANAICEDGDALPEDLDPMLDERDASHVASLRRAYLTGFVHGLLSLMLQTNMLKRHHA
jgi:hypothetical protein